MATEAISAPFYAPIGDRYGRRPVVLILIAFWGLFAMGFGLSTSVITAVLMRGCRTSTILSSGCADGQSVCWLE